VTILFAASGIVITFHEVNVFTLESNARLRRATCFSRETSVRPKPRSFAHPNGRVPLDRQCPCNFAARDVQEKSPTVQSGKAPSLDNDRTPKGEAQTKSTESRAARSQTPG